MYSNIFLSKCLEIASSSKQVFKSFFTISLASSLINELNEISEVFIQYLSVSHIFYLDSFRAYSQHAQVNSSARDHLNCIARKVKSIALQDQAHIFLALETQVALELYLWWLCFLGFYFFLPSFLAFVSSPWPSILVCLCISNSGLDISLHNQRKRSRTVRPTSVAQSKKHLLQMYVSWFMGQWFRIFPGWWESILSGERWEKIWFVNLHLFVHFTICELKSIKEITFECREIEQTLKFVFLFYFWPEAEVVEFKLKFRSSHCVNLKYFPTSKGYYYTR